MFYTLINLLISLTQIKTMYTISGDLIHLMFSSKKKINCGN